MASLSFTRQFSPSAAVTYLPRALIHLQAVISNTRTPSARSPDDVSSSMYASASRSLQGEAPRQFLTSDKETIVCVHPGSPVDISNTKPLHPYKPELDLLRKELTPEEAKFVKQLRSEDPSLWSVATLARLFNVKRIAISKVAPADSAHQEHLDREKAIAASMKPYKRKIYLAQKKLEHQKRLEKVIAERNYNFPCTT